MWVWPFLGIYIFSFLWKKKKNSYDFVMLEVFRNVRSEMFVVVARRLLVVSVELVFFFLLSNKIVRLSLLTMTNPNQLCDVLLFVCSKMADETNLSSKLPIADRTREVWGRKLCWWCLSSGFPLCTFLLGFADFFCFVFTSSPSYEASPLCSILCNLLPWLCWYVEVFKEDFEVSLYRFFWPPWERFPTGSSP